MPGREEAADVVCNGVGNAGNDEDGDGAYSSSGEVVSDTMENSIRVFPVLNIKHSFAKCRSEFTIHLSILGNASSPSDWCRSQTLRHPQKQLGLRSIRILSWLDIFRTILYCELFTVEYR